MSDVEKADCMRCVHFAVTWDPKHPKSCKLFGFKSAYPPSLTVYKSTGTECMGFERKVTQNKKVT